MSDENARRRYTTNPRYSAKKGLPSVFPFKRDDIAGDHAAALAKVLCEQIEGGSAYYFAVTGNSNSTDGHVTLWLSAQAAAYLEGMGYLRYVQEVEAS